MKKLLLALTLAGVAQGMSAANSYGLPDKIQDCNILHCFDWTFSDIEYELPNIAAAGFGAVQISPVQGNCNSNAEWFYAYMPYDFAFKANGNGSRQALINLCAEAEKYGIKIVVDVVANHVNQASAYHDSWWDGDGRVRWNGSINYGDRYSITHGQLGEYGDVNSEDAEVRARAKAFIEDLKSIGVSGIRWDAAKHIALPSENCQFWPEVTSVEGLWHYGEILDGPGGDKVALLREYGRYMSVTDTEYSNSVLAAVKNGSVTSGYGAWTGAGLGSNKVVYWGESHDNYSNGGGTVYVQQDVIDRAWAIGACRNGESSLYFSRPSATTKSTIRMGQKGSTHFTSREIAAVNHLRNAMTGTRDFYTATDGVACITREGGGACIVVGNGLSREVSVENGGGYVPAGTYIDEVSGNTFTVTEATISGKVGDTGIAVIYQGMTPQPEVVFDPDGCGFEGNLTVTATLRNASEGWIQVGTAARQTITDTKTFTVGRGMSVGDKIEVTWSATGEGTTRTGSVVYTMIDASQVEPYTIYFDNTASKWETPYIHFWGGASTSTYPGVAMEYVGGDIWKKTIDPKSTGCLFNAGDGDASKTADFKVTFGHIYTTAGDQGEYSGIHGAVNNINDDNDAMPIYFDLSGRRINNPSRGIYIVRRGTAVSKEYIR